MKTIKLKLNRKYKITLFTLLLTSLLFFSLLPVFILISKSINNLNYSKETSQLTIESIFKEQGVDIFKNNANDLAERISDFLYLCITDLEGLSILPQTNSSYIKFNGIHKRYSKYFRKEIPVYKEIALIDKDGGERIKIVDNKLINKVQLKNISDSKNTTYKSEQYFFNTKTSISDYYVSHLQSWYVSRNEQLNNNKPFSGIIRFCKKVKDSNGDFNGIIVVSLDFNHLLDFIDFENLGESKLISKYKKGSYAYLIDDEGWIIAHPKLWDIRGLDKDGILIQPLNEKTPEWRLEAGIMPINLMEMDWRLKDITSGMPMSNLVERVRRGETIFTTMKSMGIKGHSPGIIRSRVYAPISFSIPPYNKYNIFGAVSIGTSQKNFLDKAESLSKKLDEINLYLINESVIITIFLSIGIIFFSYIIARSMSKSLKKIDYSLTEIGKTNYSEVSIKSYIKEIQNLSVGVQTLAKRLKKKDEKLAQNFKSLEVLNTKLVNAEKELAKYLHKEFSNEPHNILEDRINRLELDFPKLKIFRKTICIGNSAKFLRVLRQVVAQSQMTIPTWISGESGSGKTAIAKIIHNLSSRADKPYFVFAASEFAAADPIITLGKLFGYGENHGISGINKDGAKGIIEECNGGTLFIDDVDALPMNTQAQLLRVMDENSFHPAVGKSRIIISDVRFLFASHLNLEKLVDNKIIRKDFFRRIGGNYNKIEIPPLRERKDDIIKLANHFLEQFNSKTNSSFSFSESAKQKLLSHDYTGGNIAELKVIIQYACENTRIDHTNIVTNNHLIFESRNIHIKNSINKQSSISSNHFDNDEVIKLEILRKNNFLMDISEKELGYKNGSRTLSHHFRGICFKLYVTSNYDIDKTVEIITNSTDLELNKKILLKIRKYLDNTSAKIKEGTTQSLFKNLPKTYHKYLTTLVEKL